METTVPVLGLSYFACFAAALILRSVVTSGLLAAYQIFFIPLATFSALCAIAVWWRPRVGFVAAAAMSGVFMAIFFLTRDGNDVITVLSNPVANSLQFIFYVTAVPTFFSTFIYSTLGFRNLRNQSKRDFKQETGPTIPRSSILALLVLGFILGGLGVGLLGAASETRLIAAFGNQPTQGNTVTIVIGAASPTNAQFYSPANITIKAGTTITWVNHDTAPHTVTSVTTAFDSGDMDIGATYRFTFSGPGTYSYYCTYHTWMKGTVVVTA